MRARAAPGVLPRRRCRDPLAPLRETECETCPERSWPDPDPRQAEAGRWAIRHTTRTDHRAFRELMTGRLVVSPAPTNPLHQDNRATHRVAHAERGDNVEERP
ncbi:DUF7848 domain-containing protein [Streptomyces tsukubensis]